MCLFYDFPKVPRSLVSYSKNIDLESSVPTTGEYDTGKEGPDSPGIVPLVLSGMLFLNRSGIL